MANITGLSGFDVLEYLDSFEEGWKTGFEEGMKMGNEERKKVETRLTVEDLHTSRIRKLLAEYE